MDSNQQPSGYEPDELPIALLCYINKAKQKFAGEYFADAEELLRSYFEELTLQGYSETSIFLYLQNTQTGVIGLEPMNVRIKI